MSAFDAAFNDLMMVEKGFWNDPVGGPTMYGVTQKVALAHGFTGNMQLLPLDLAKSIAKAEYWDKFMCDQFDPVIGYQIFDAAYNGGYPAKWLQKAVGVTADGVIGAETIAAVRRTEATKIVARFNASRIRYMQSLGNFKQNAGGWFLRIANNLEKGAI